MLWLWGCIRPCWLGTFEGYVIACSVHLRVKCPEQVTSKLGMLVPSGRPPTPRPPRPYPRAEVYIYVYIRIHMGTNICIYVYMYMCICKLGDP